eukprot:gnl/TRDRNA2_/TRDRNA2_162647_c1_seq3.p1 gnl/TRDRNA2_/TRDRNA2_162647_c1~~gnl/TRDRNA2_/TRDRNA2_162647_c1_seq3.p1  ORF type:complete len:104 (-),score=23.13 gnl/TRDRNA2_/TRDRNA2_162647_c1_seq3:277-588(-)
MLTEELQREGTYDEIAVRCISPTSFLKELSLDASAIDILHVDAEGYEFALVNEFAALPGFGPAVIVFEFLDDPARADMIAAALVSHGMTVHTEGWDLFAVFTR